MKIISNSKHIKIIALSFFIFILLVLIFVSFRKLGANKRLFLPGTQPKTVASLASPLKCFLCHEDKTFNRAPATLYRGSMHSMAMRDPLFLAALAVTNIDLKNSGTFCIRCHSQSAFLGERDMPPDGSALNETDRWGVVCDFCHRLVDPLSKEGKALAEPDVTKYENAMFVLSPDANTKRGPYNDSIAPHLTKNSEFHRRGDICGTCHDVTNPVNNVPVERTYSEWKQSWYAKQGEKGNCQSCHMRSRAGYASGPYYNYGSPYRENLPNHDFAGGSNWIYDTLPYFFNDIDEDALAEGKKRALKQLKTAAKLDILLNEELKWGYKKHITVRVTNLTGHKLPTGFAEGRRIWLNVKAYDKEDKLIYESGKYDYENAELLKDEEIKVYEAKPGIKGKGPTFHFVLNNYIEKDNRIPPKGFTNANFNKVGAGVISYKYMDDQYWDDTIYQVPFNAKKVAAVLYYQTTSKDYIEFLREKDTKSPYGKKLYEVWKKTGKSAPVEMSSSELTLK